MPHASSRWTWHRGIRAVHEKLAIIYQELGMPEISEQHTKLSADLIKRQE